MSLGTLRARLRRWPSAGVGAGKEVRTAQPGRVGLTEGAPQPQPRADTRMCRTLPLCCVLDAARHAPPGPAAQASCPAGPAPAARGPPCRRSQRPAHASRVDLSLWPSCLTASGLSQPPGRRLVQQGGPGRPTSLTSAGTLAPHRCRGHKPQVLPEGGVSTPGFRVPVVRQLRTQTPRNAARSAGTEGKQGVRSATCSCRQGS